MLVATTFWETFFLCLIFLPLALVSGFALRDIFRRYDIGGVSKAIWVAVAQLKVLADLHDRGKLTDEEYAAEKSRVVSAPFPTAAANTVAQKG